MDVTSKIEHKCSVDAEISYTSFEWSLRHWSLLRNVYEEGFRSPEFEIMQTDKCTCDLMFYAGLNRFEQEQDDEEEEDHPYGPSTATRVNFNKDFKFVTLLAKISIVGKRLTRPCASESRREKIDRQVLVLNFDKDFDEEMEKQFLVDDTLKLFFELYVVKHIAESPLRTNTCDPNFGTIARNKLEDMFKAKELCDVTFIVQGQLFPAHKLVLSTNSDVFRKMFKSQVKEQEDGPVEIDDVDADLFEAFLKYMYTGNVEETDEMVPRLTAVANKYQVIDLMKSGETYMINHLNIKNATQYLLIAHRMHLEILEEEAVKFMKSNTQILADPAKYILLSDYPNLVTKIFG